MSKKLTYKEFIKKYIDKYGELKYEFVESTFVNSNTPMKIICKKHGEFWKTPRNILKYNCLKCSYELRGKNYTLTTNEFIEKANKIHNNKYNYEKVNYTGTKKNIIIICPIHGEFIQKPNDHLSGKGCPYCNESHLEKKVKNILDENNIKYIRQYKTIFLGKQSLDFFLPNYNIGIECQGKQHFGLSTLFNDYQHIISLDIKKYNLCKENNINIIYITDKKFLKNIPNLDIYKNNIFEIENLIKCIIQKK